MRRRTGRTCLLVVAIATASARADILPTPDPGPFTGSAGGLDFSIQSVTYTMGPQGGPHYTKTGQVVVLDGCTDGKPNCRLARVGHLIGMEVETVDGENLRAEKGMIRQILAAFANKAAGRKIVFELYRRDAGSEVTRVSFDRK